MADKVTWSETIDDDRQVDLTADSQQNEKREVKMIDDINSKLVKFEASDATEADITEVFNLDVEKITLRIQLNVASDSLINSGLTLMRIKAGATHGEFMDTITEVGIGQRYANSLMKIAAAFKESNWSLSSNLGYKKSYALTMLESETFNEFVAGKEFAGVSIEDYQGMTVKQAEAFIRQLKGDKELLEAKLETEQQLRKHIVEDQALAEKRLKDKMQKETEEKNTALKKEWELALKSKDILLQEREKQIRRLEMEPDEEVIAAIRLQVEDEFEYELKKARQDVADEQAVRLEMLANRDRKIAELMASLNLENGASSQIEVEKAKLKQEFEAKLLIAEVDFKRKETALNEILENKEELIKQKTIAFQDQTLVAEAEVKAVLPMIEKLRPMATQFLFAIKEMYTQLNDAKHISKMARERLFRIAVSEATSLTNRLNESLMWIHYISHDINEEFGAEYMEKLENGEFVDEVFG